MNQRIMNLLSSFLVLLFISFSASLSAQCPPTMVLLESQSDVNDFVSNYSTCTSVSVYLVFG